MGYFILFFSLGLRFTFTFDLILVDEWAVLLVVLLQCRCLGISPFQVVESNSIAILVFHRSDNTLHNICMRFSDDVVDALAVGF